MKQFSRFGTMLCAVGVLTLCTGGSASAITGPADVSLEVAGGSAPLVVQTPLATTTTPVVKDGVPADSCTGTSAAGALEVGTGGGWSGPWYGGSLGYSVEAIKGEAHTFGSGAYWSFYVNGKAAEAGVCGVELKSGDRVQFYPACESPNTTHCAAGEPMQLTAPAKVKPGVPFGVSLTESDTTYGGPPDYATTSIVSPSAGATVGGVATAADGGASVTLTTPGPQILTATKGNRPPATAQVCVTSGTDGLCDSPSIVAPANTRAPSVSGSTTIGGTLTCAKGTWTGTDPVFTYQWLKGDAPVSGATSTTHTVAVGDAGVRLACRVQATNVVGGAAATSDPVSIPALAPVPVPVPLPGAAVARIPATQLKRGFAVSRTGSAVLLFRCVSAAGSCAVNGTVTGTVPSARRAAGAKVRTVAVIRSVTIRKGATRKVGVRLGVATLKRLQKAGVRRLKVTIKVRTAVDGAVVRTSQRTVLRIPAARRAARAPAFTG